ncbi:MAG: hypothetical protein LR011_08400 [Verrucomicrobia bacterium]|nr:hypothetical protein [Verrucomicrobiota bacterium]
MIYIRTKSKMAGSMGKFGAMAGFLSVALNCMTLGTAAPSYSPTFVATATEIRPASSDGKLSAFTYLSFQQMPAEVCRGVITQLTAQSVQDTLCTLPAGKLNFNSKQGGYFLHILTGNAAGMRADITSNTGDGTIQIARDLSRIAKPGDQFAIRKHFTIASVFGKVNEKSALTAGQSIDGFDNLILVKNDGSTQRYFHVGTDPRFSLWMDQDFRESGGVHLDAFQGMIIRRTSPESTFVYNTGVVHDVPTLIEIHPGFNLIGTGNSQTAITLDQLGLVSASSSDGIASASNPAQADNIVIFDENGQGNTYFHLKYTNVTGWYSFDFKEAGQVEILPGQAFYINRLPSNGAFGWFPPEE